MQEMVFFFCCKEFYYPANAGFPLGRADSPKVVILEIHYDNPEQKEGTLLKTIFFPHRAVSVNSFRFGSL